jgi:hypothetical protein
MGVRKLAAVCTIAGLAACASDRAMHAAERSNEPIHALLSADVMMFVSFDTNGDLQISQDELTAGIAREFARADTNHDGVIEPIEFQNWANAVLGGQQMGPYRLDFDRNVDNIITREEFDHEIRARFNDYDTDGNGVVTRAEFVRLVGRARPAPRVMEQGPGNGGQSRGGGDGPGG